MSDCDEFQCNEKDEFMHLPSYFPEQIGLQQRNGPYKMQQHPQWKYSPIKTSSENKPMKKEIVTNISFEASSGNESEHSEEQDEGQQYSSLAQAYRDADCVYRRRVNYGTSWVGNRQYFASVFASYAKIARTEQNVFAMGGQPDYKLFDSAFESGNLLAAYRVGKHEYDLVLQNDINTKGNTQWFYFKLMHPPAQQNIKLNIVNMRKGDSLFNYGMLPCVHSSESNKKYKTGWQRRGSNVSYFRNEYRVEGTRRCYYTLTFTLSTSFDKDTLSIAQCYPYTLTDLNKYLAEREKRFERQTIVNTLGKNKVQVLTIKDNNKIKNRPIIVVMARQHPGETPASYVCEGFLDFVLSKEKQAEYLRKNYIIKVIPIVNPDGVVAGNYRSNFYGFDLNRRWDGSARNNAIHQSTFIKKYILSLSKQNEIVFVIDLHGHSRKLYSFFYGNPSTNPFTSRVFPLLCSKLSPTLIRFEDSTFTSQECKRSTARVQFGLNKIPNVLTYEVSFFGYMNKEKEKKHFTQDGYKQLGAVLGRALFIYERSKREDDSRECALIKKCLNELRNNAELMVYGEKKNAGSDSEPEECELVEKEEQRLQEEYAKEQVKSVRIVKKIVRKEAVSNLYKSSRQMQVLDIARVHSIFPNDILALIPSSFYGKNCKKTTTGVQTEHCALLKIYQACKEQDEANLLRSNILTRPNTSALANDAGASTQLAGTRGNFTGSVRRTRDVRPRKDSLYEMPAKKELSRATQTALSLATKPILLRHDNNPENNFSKMLLINETNVEKMYQSSYSTIQPIVTETKQWLDHCKKKSIL